MSNRQYDGRYLAEYCCGCGLCKSICGLKFEEKNGFSVPQITDDALKTLNEVCPSATSAKRTGTEPHCGPYLGAYLGFAADESVRTLGSSGGVLTALALYLLERGLVDGVLQIMADPDTPWRTLACCSYSREDILRCAGSRYAQSLTLEHFKDYLGTGKKYLLVGKPCDIRAARNYAAVDESVNTAVPYMFSFFCMGTPSENANLNLLHQMNLRPEQCRGLRYRGDGWPGYTIAETADSTRQQMTYNESWGAILGRDLRKYCKFCMDGFGDAADIACGDAWYLDENNNPVFEEHDGRNVVFVRSEKGKALFEAAAAEHRIECSTYENIAELRFIQKSQFARKELMRYRQLAMTLLCKRSPRYQSKYLKAFAKEVPLKRKLDAFLGTASRAIKGRL